MTVKLYVNWMEEEIITSMDFQKLCDLKQNKLEANEDFLDIWFEHDKRLSAAEVFRMSQDELDALKKEYSMYCRDSAEVILIEEDGWFEKEIEI